MKVFATAGPIAKECAELLTRVANNESSDEENERKETKKCFWILNSHRDFTNLIWILQF